MREVIVSMLLQYLMLLNALLFIVWMFLELLPRG